ncbi:MAG: ComF family protein [Candidatus Zixiibacteriota bacterium]|nr:MAG: ComF family protein [candidate division Zixibacteria bacterium]
MRVDPIRIHGEWDLGFCLDYHTISSVKVDVDQFETLRTELGEALYQFKYRKQRKHLLPLAETVSNFIREEILPSEGQIDFLLSVPPTQFRFFQPLKLLSRKVSKLCGIPFRGNAIVRTRELKPLKYIDDFEKRKKMLEGAFDFYCGFLDTLRGRNPFRGKRVILLDDLYRSGSTLNEVCRPLRVKGEVSKIIALAVTKTTKRR